MIQPSIPQNLIWNPENDDARFRHLVDLSAQALLEKPDLLVWPEAAIPKLLRFNSETYETVSGLARKNRVWMIVGADDAEPRQHTPQPNDADYFNSSFLISPDGKLASRYRKRSLVIFGEYIPLVKWLPFLSWFTPIQGGFTPGDAPVPFKLQDLGFETSVLICFEDVFPVLGRSAASADTDFLVNLTNNGWFGEGSAQWQHAVSGVFRAVENRRPLIRCTNSGLTCWIDAHGRIRQVFRDPEGTIYGEGFMLFDLPLPEPQNRPAPTFYNRHGDVFGWTCVAITLTPLVWLIGRRKVNSSKTQSA
jgi:apolipoprotein N-acyltransferase